MSELKTLKDLELERLRGFDGLDKFEYVKVQKLRENAINWIKALRQKSDEHWKKLDESQYVDFKDTKDEDAYSFTFMGVRWDCWHEATDIVGAEKVLRVMFNITEEEVPYE